ncbi:polysaccharide deacetylase family protein [Nostoc mirabile]|uniref:polysaccharide deacetylase family protein n=1 Tax=Nostoc mirabile TaxID=2907820 RepID=UPI0027E20310|nr:polysaccharide deacetylase family protein [Nostoc mirabile]
MLDILKQNDVKMTFFWVGQALQANPDLANKPVCVYAKELYKHCHKSSVDSNSKATDL